MVKPTLLTTVLGGILLVPSVFGLGQRRCIAFPEDDRSLVPSDGPQRRGIVEDAGHLVLDALEALSGTTNGYGGGGHGGGQHPEHPPHPPHRGSHGFILASSAHHYAAPILLDSSDDYAIHIAAVNFAKDIERVTGVRPRVYNDTLPKGTTTAVVVGTSGSGLVGGIGLEHVRELEGKWEAFDARVVQRVRGLEEALVISGSDRRGTIFGMYDLSEQMGVSPWYFWDDVHTPHHPLLSFVADGICAHGEPTVKYRGLFINDEIPVLWNWARETFNVSYPENPIQVGVYERVYETILRMKGNYLWPAMWVSMFDVDGLDWPNHGLPKSPIPGPNQVLAQQMGIVVGQSHHEPMARNKPEWDLEGSGDWDWRTNQDKMRDWWTYGAARAKGMETTFTMGMRGDGDRPLVGASKELLEEIAGAQQDILREVFETDDLSDVPQLWCLYKEVQSYYLDGLQVPEEVTIMMADDNWGNLMGVLPWGSEHKGGGGIYYHADYVGKPTQYKWINTISLAKTWEQMQIARAFKTDRIWIINVGDIKHHELPAEWFLHLAYDFDAWPINSVDKFLRLWAAREFGKAHSEEIADIVAQYSLYVSRFKPELYNSTAFSYVNYEEAERIEEAWNDLFTRAERVYHKLEKAHRPAYFEYVYTPVALVTQANRMYLSVGRANHHATQARTSANRYAEKAVKAFQQDYNLTQMFHEMLHGKWNHMLEQPHLNQPYVLHQLRNTMPPVSYIQENQPAIPRWDGTRPGQPSYVRYTIENSYGAYPGHNYLNCDDHYGCGNTPSLYRMDPYGAPRRWVDVGAGGPMDSTWTATPNASWVKVHPDHGKIMRDGTTDTRVYISVDWDQIPNPSEGEDLYHANATIDFSASDGSNITVFVPVTKPRAPPSDFKGHVQGDGYIVMEAGHFTHNSTAEGYSFEEIEWYGRTLSGVEMYPTTNQNFTLGTGPSLSYDFWTIGESGLLTKEWDGHVDVTVQIGPTFNFMMGGEELAFGLQLDDWEPVEIHPVAPMNKDTANWGTVPEDWDPIVRVEIRNVTASFNLPDPASPGKHTIKLWGMTAGVVVERIWVDLGGILERGYSFLGPPESKRV